MNSMQTNQQKLRRGQRYLFHVNAPNEIYKSFRSNFVAFYETTNTLIVNNSETERWANTQVSMPFDWVTKIETLEDITYGETILPEDVLLLIDSYL
jgi:hypothetical protein